MAQSCNTVRGGGWKFVDFGAQQTKATAAAVNNLHNLQFPNRYLKWMYLDNV